MPNRGPEPNTSDERLLIEILLTRGPAAFASEIEEEVPLSRQRISKRLGDLESDGLVVSKKAAGRRLWWATDAGKSAAADAIRQEIS